jgi:hypothetical protein
MIEYRSFSLSCLPSFNPVIVCTALKCTYELFNLQLLDFQNVSYHLIVQYGKPRSIMDQLYICTVTLNSIFHHFIQLLPVKNA